MTKLQTATGSGGAWTVLIVGMLAAFGAGKLPPALLVIADQFQMSLFQASFLISLFQLAGALGGVFAGTLADRYGHRNIMQLGLAMTLMGIALGLFAGNSTILLVSRAVESLGFILTVLPGPSLLGQLIPAQRLKLWLGGWGTYMPVGFSAALLLSPLIMQVRFVSVSADAAAWQSVWIVHGVLVVAGWAALRAWVPGASKGAQGLSSTPASAQVSSIERRSFWPLLRLTLSTPGPWLLAGSFAFYTGQYLSVVAFLPTIYQQSGLALSVIGPMTALVAGINLLGNLAAGQLIQREVNPGSLLIFAALCLFIGSWVVFVSDLSFSARYGVVVLMSACCGLIPGTMFVLASRYAPSSDTVSSTVGLMQQGGAIGQVLTPPLVAWSAGAAGHWSNAWYVLGLLALANLVLALAIHRREVSE